MGTELFGAYVKDEKLDIPSVPPGFESLTSFTLRRVEESTMITCSASSTASESQSAQTTMEIDGDCAKIIRSLRQRPWINHGHCNNNSEDEYEVDQLQQNLPVRHGLPKGVIRGCPDCSNCQKVVARWRPEDACKPGVLDAPVFYPNEEEFEDTLEYISSIRLKAEQYGICRIVPPPSWKPPCSFKEKSVWECSKFGTRVQRIDKLQNRSSMRKLSKIQNNKRKRKKCMRMGVDCGVGSSNPSDHGDTGLSEADSFGFEPGPDFTLDTFNKYADDFKAQYFSKSQTVRETNMFTPNEQWEPSPEIIEGEYWRMVEKPTEEIEVLYGADLETGTFSSGFPKMSNQFGSASDEKYIKSGWNLNNFPRLPGSVLSYESSDISGVLVPWLYIGMCFSSFCWHVEDHHLYSLNYLHWGAPKIWYGVPACDALKLETAMRKHLPDLFEEQPDLLHKLVTQLSPSILKSEGVPVYRCVQNPGEFVLTFPRAYHSGFNCGFNCAEAVNVAPIDWLPHGQIAVELYCKQGRRTSISHDKLLFGAAKEAVKAHWELKLVKKNTVDNLKWKSVCVKDGILSKALKTRVEMERMRRDFLCSSTQAMKMDISFDATTERECAICLFDLHLSAAGCHCSPDRYVCLNHAKQLCGCARSARFFLFRYDINELNILVEALEGKLSAIYRWARMDLGLALSSSVSKSNMQTQESTGKLSSFSEGKAVQDVNLQGSVKPLEIVFALKHMKASPSYDRPSIETKKANHGSLIKKEESILPILNLSSPCCPVSKKETSFSGSPVAEKPEVNVILLSDDEGQEPKKPISTLSTKHSENMQPQESTGKLSSFSEGKAGQDVNLQGSVKPLEIVFALKHMKASPSYDRPLPETKKANHGSLIKKEEFILPTSNLSSPRCQVSKKETSYSGSPVAEKPEVNVILLSDDEGQEPKKPVSTLSTKHSEIYGNMAIYDDRRNSVLTPMSYAKTKWEGDATSLHNEVQNGSSPIKEEEDQHKGGMVLGSDFSCQLDSTNVNSNKIVNHFLASIGSILQPPMTGKPHDEDKHEKIETNDKLHIIKHVNNVDKGFCQKGPRIAKAVRRINCNVEPVQLGVALSGELWCNNQTIFPKGFKSRVRYNSVLDPTNMSYYVSEILDAGDRPLFMVSLEHCSSEVFIHVTPARCWEMVRERVNQEIAKQHKLGRKNLPPLQPPGSVDGFEMFGFSSPAIVQAVEALDQSRVCEEYWKSRPYSRPHVQISHTRDSGGRLNGQGDSGNRAVYKILGGLFKKANPEELRTLYSILNNGTAETGNGHLVIQLLREEIYKRSR